MSPEAAADSRVPLGRPPWGNGRLDFFFGPRSRVHSAGVEIHGSYPHEKGGVVIGLPGLQQRRNQKQASSRLKEANLVLKPALISDKPQRDSRFH